MEQIWSLVWQIHSLKNAFVPQARPTAGPGRQSRVESVPYQCCWFPQHNRPGFHLVSHRILRNLGDFHWKKQDNCSAACSLQGPRGCEAAQAPGAMAAVVAGGGLQITRIAAYRACLPLLEGRYRWGDGKFVDVFDTTVVRVETNVPGLVGHGENCPLGANYLPMFPAATRAGISELAPHLLGHDPTRLGALNSRMDWLMTGQPAPKSAIDMACWDILGKVAGLPVCELLGGRHTDEGYDLYRAISQDAAEAMAQNVRQYVEEGYSKFQLKVGGRPHEDIERISGSEPSAPCWTPRQRRQASTTRSSATPTPAGCGTRHCRLSIASGISMSTLRCPARPTTSARLSVSTRTSRSFSTSAFKTSG